MLWGFLFLSIALFSVVLHEIAHAVVALWFGDDTARSKGRITLNPLPHIDLFGSVFLPVISYFSSGFIVAWAKPVPVDFLRLKPRFYGAICVSFAGIVMNVLLAAFFGTFIQLGIGPWFFQVVCMYVVLANSMLIVINLFPIPPLDGSRIITLFLPWNAQFFLERNALVISMCAFFIIVLFKDFLMILVSWLFIFFGGHPLFH